MLLKRARRTIENWVVRQSTQLYALIRLYGRVSVSGLSHSSRRMALSVWHQFFCVSVCVFRLTMARLFPSMRWHDEAESIKRIRWLFRWWCRWRTRRQSKDRRCLKRYIVFGVGTYYSKKVLVSQTEWDLLNCIVYFYVYLLIFVFFSKSVNFGCDRQTTHVEYF